MIRKLIVALFLHLSVCSAGDPCPPKAQLAPCTCSEISDDISTSTTELQLLTTPIPERPKRDIGAPTVLPMYGNDTFYTVVECKAAKSIHALEEAVSSALNRKLVDKLVVSNVPPLKEQILARLPSRWLKNVRVRNFQILNSKLSGDFIWYGNPLEGQEKSLLWFSVHNSFLFGSLTFDTPGTVNTKGLNSLPFIQGLDFSNNILTLIMATSFKTPPTNLSTVIMSRNSIQSIETGTFHHTPLLRYIDLSHNLLESIARGVFASTATNLKHIDLSWNLLKALAPDLFTSMPALRSVNISNNFLHSMPEKPWSIAWRVLTDIDVTGNFVECNCELIWLLSIISPPMVNVSLTPAPRPLPGQTVLGTCSRIVQPHSFASKYDLTSLTRDKLVC